MQRVCISCVQLFATPWTVACQASLSFTISRSFLDLMSIESVMPSSHLILCFSLLLLPSIFSSIRVFCSELALNIRGVCVCVCVCVKLLQSCQTLCDSMDCKPTYGAPLSMGFFREEYWTGLPCPPPGDLPDPRIEPVIPATIPALQVDSGFYWTFILFLCIKFSLYKIF